MADRRDELEAQRLARKHFTTGNKLCFTYSTPPSGPPPPLTLAQAVREIRGTLDRLSESQHEDFEGHGGLCPICGLATSLPLGRQPQPRPP